MTSIADMAFFLKQGLPLFQNDNKMHFLWGGLFGSVLVYNKRVSIALSEIGY